jgi:ubiquinone/menaquinone biosynthesis C-methylase UbiE
MNTQENAHQDAEYVLGTHDAELARLSLQHKLWSGSAFDCWERAGIGPGKTVLDLGCGPGYTTLDLAALVAPTGQVLAIDESARFIEHLKKQQQTLGLTSIDVRVMDAQYLDIAEASIDVVYTRWVLCYVSNPDTVLQGVVKALRPGGVFAVQDYLNLGGQLLAPMSKAHARVVQVMVESWEQRGGDTKIGMRLPELMHRYGLIVEEIRPVQRIIRPGSPLWLWPSTFFRNFVPLLVEHGLLSEQEQHDFEQEWSERARDNTAFFWAPPMVEVIARKPQTERGYKSYLANFLRCPT